VGMAAVKAAVQARGGQVRVWSEAERGTRVRLQWPAGVLTERSAPLAAPSAPADAPIFSDSR
jgi:hypothetical protein